MKTAVITFFDSHPPKTGSGIVCSDFFKLWPVPKKKLFQFSKKKIKTRNIETISIFKNNPIYKLINLPILLLNIIKYFKKEKNKIVIIEGPSWIFYSFFVIIFLKIIYQKKIFFIYRSHSIEYEIRKNNSNILITMLTKFFENYVVNICDISTAVSKLEQFKFKKYYNCKTFLFPNSLDIERLKKIKPRSTTKIPEKFIIFSGSYDYQPNRIAINFIINKILPKIKKENIKLVLTGNHNKKFNNEDVFNLGFVPINKLKYLQKKSICLIVPIFQGYGTRIKILESLIWGNRIISTSKGIEGIEHQNNRNIIVCNKLKKMINAIIKFSKSKKNTKYNSNIIENFSMLGNSIKLLKYFKNRK